MRKFKCKGKIQVLVQVVEKPELEFEVDYDDDYPDEDAICNAAFNKLRELYPPTKEYDEFGWWSGDKFIEGIIGEHQFKVTEIP